MRPLIPALGGLILAVSGCGTSLQPDPTAAEKADVSNGIFTDDQCRYGSGASQRVVVSFHGSRGFNPYHLIFRRGGDIYGNREPSAITPEVLDEFGITEREILDMTLTGNPEADFAADQAMWASLKPNVHYWFRGTNVIAVSILPQQNVILVDEETTGLLTGGNPALLALPPVVAALRANPDAVILLTQGETADEQILFLGAGGLSPTKDILQPELAHPAIDIAAIDYEVNTESAPTQGAHTGTFRFVTECGRVFISAASERNPERRTTFQPAAGPWWTMAVGGFEEGGRNGRRFIEGNPVDFVAPSTVDAPVCARCQTEMQAVDSAAVAMGHAAGLISRVILEARRATRHIGGVQGSSEAPVLIANGSQSLTTWDLRRALEQAAAVPEFSEFNATNSNSIFPVAPVFDQAPWLNTGWGVLSAREDRNVVSHALAALGLFDFSVPAKDSGFCIWQTQFMDERRAYWNQIQPFSPSFGFTEDPYIPC